MRHQTALSVVAAWAGMYIATAAHSDTAGAPMSGTNTPGMSMPMAGQPAGGAATREAYTNHHAFLIKIQSLPDRIPFEKYFSLRLAVYDGRHPGKALADAHLTVTAGMRHGLKVGFAHAMQSSPQIVATDGVFVVSGLYFHMAGPWTLEVDVERNNQRGTAYFTLPCCGS